MTKPELVAGASASLNKTITTIMKFLEDESARPARELRPFLNEKIADLAAMWYARGLRRGHIESYKEFVDKGRVSRKLRYEGKREFFKGQERQVRVKSKIRSNT